MPDASGDLFVSRSLTIPAGELHLQVGRSGGPGGQHANTSDTKVTITWEVTTSVAPGPIQRARLIDRLGPVVRAVASDERSQWRNRQLARDRLAERVRGGLAVQAPRTRTRPTRSSVERRLDAKRVQARRKQERRAPDVAAD